MVDPVSISDMGDVMVAIHGVVDDIPWMMRADNNREIVYIRIWPTTSDGDRVWLPCFVDKTCEVRTNRDENPVQVGD